MKIHEYQAKELMKQRGIAVPIGRVATTVDEAVAAVRPVVEAGGHPVVVVKSQIHAGGRGKGRFLEHPDLAGVNVVTDGLKGGVEAAEAKVRELAEKMLGSTLATVQTGPEGKQVNRLYIEQGIDIARWPTTRRAASRTGWASKGTRSRTACASSRRSRPPRRRSTPIWSRSTRWS
ncbi:MAG: hypothetical protein P8Y02_03945 [Deinococcales bacterium]